MKNKFDLRFTKTEYLIKSEFIKLLEKNNILIFPFLKYANMHYVAETPFMLTMQIKMIYLIRLSTKYWIELIKIAFFALTKFKN